LPGRAGRTDRSLIVDQVGWQNSLYALLACSILTWLAIELMSRWYDSAR